MTKSEFKDTVKNKIFSVRWLKNDGTEGYIHRGFLGLNKKVEGEPSRPVFPKMEEIEEIVQGEK